MVDYLNGPGRFFRLRTPDRVFLINKNFVARVVFQFWKQPNEFCRGGARGVGPSFEEIVECGVASEKAIEC